MSLWQVVVIYSKLSAWIRQLSTHRQLRTPRIPPRPEDEQAPRDRTAASSFQKVVDAIQAITPHSFLDPLEDFYRHLYPVSTGRSMFKNESLDMALSKVGPMQDVVIIKVMSFKDPGSLTMSSATREILLMKEVKHENLQCLLGSFYSVEQRKLSLVSDFMDGKSLAEVIECYSSLAESVIASVTLQV
jgi:serine/threonine protein kinase